MDDATQILEMLETVQRNFGLLGLILGAIIIVAAFWMYSYFKSYVNRTAELSADRTLEKFKSELDKEVFKSNKLHEKQVNAIHEVYQRLQKLIRVINHNETPEKFVQQMSNKEEVELLIKCRHEFKKAYFENKLLFTEAVQGKIDRLLPLVDEYIETYAAGLFPEEDVSQQEEGEHDNGGLIMAGVWSLGAFDKILPPLREVSAEIERDFRSIYGTK